MKCHDSHTSFQNILYMEKNAIILVLYSKKYLIRERRILPYKSKFSLTHNRYGPPNQKENFINDVNVMIKASSWSYGSCTLRFYSWIKQNTTILVFNLKNMSGEKSLPTLIRILRVIIIVD